MWSRQPGEPRDTAPPRVRTCAGRWLHGAHKVRSWRFAPSVAQRTGMPARSHSSDHFRPRLSRSVGLGPVPGSPQGACAPVDVGGRSTPDGPSFSPLRRRSTKAGVLCVCRPGSGGACCGCAPGRGLLLRSGLGPMRGDAEPADAGRVGVFSWSGPCSADRRHRPSPRGFPVGMFSSAGVRVRDRSALSEPPAGAPLGCSAAQGSVFGGSPPSPIAARIPGRCVRQRRGPCSADRHHRPSPRGFPVGVFGSGGVRVRERSALSESPVGAPLGCSAAEGSVFGSAGVRVRQRRGPCSGQVRAIGIPGRGAVGVFSSAGVCVGVCGRGIAW